MPIASDDEKALDIAAELVRETGCEPVITGKLETAHIFAPGAPGFRAHLPADKLRKRLGL